MTNKSRKDKFAELYEHVCNDDEAKANELFHELVVEMARDIHNEMLTCEEGIHDDELEADMESDLANDLKDVHGDHEEGHLEADAEEDLANDMLDDEDMVVDGDEEAEDVASELHHHEDEDKNVEAKVDELEDHMMDVDAEIEKLQAMFDEMSDEEHADEVAEAVEMSKVSVKMGGEQGGGHFAGTEVNTKSPSANADRVKLGGQPIEMGKGPDHKGFERQEPTVKAKDMGKFKNAVKSAKDVLDKAGHEKSGYLENPHAEVGAGKSGMPMDASKDSTIGSKK